MEDTTNTANTRPLTFGEKAVGLAFNPSNDPDVQQMKHAFAGIIDGICEIEAESGSELGNLKIEAIRQAQTAQMWAVKALTWKD